MRRSQGHRLPTPRIDRERHVASYVNGVSRNGANVDQKQSPGNYWKMGHMAHIAEEIRSKDAGFLHVCEGMVTTGPKE